MAKKRLKNPVYEYDEEDPLGFVLGDPDLTEDMRRALYEVGAKKYGEREGGFEGIKILTKEESDEAYLELRRKFDPIYRGKGRAKKIFDCIMDGAEKLLDGEGRDDFERLEKLNDFLADKPINAYVLFQLMTLILDNETKYKASLAAQKRHLETYELKKQAIDFWCANIDSKLSNEKAADLLTKIVPLSHRKLSQYVSEAKKQNIHPASKT
jgi:hypothetical protein